MAGGLVQPPLRRGVPHRGQLAVECPGQGPPPQSLLITERRPPDSSCPSATGIYQMISTNIHQMKAKNIHQMIAKYIHQMIAKNIHKMIATYIINVQLFPKYCLIMNIYCNVRLLCVILFDLYPVFIQLIFSKLNYISFKIN